MKISKELTQKVNDGVAALRKDILSATIALLKKMGHEPGEDVMLPKILIMHHENANGLTQTILADRIGFCESDTKSPYYVLMMGEDNFTAADLNLSISNMQSVYDIVLKMARAK